jgi:hypothetical protein
LIDLPDREVVEAFRDPEVVKTVFLSGQDPGCECEEGKYRTCSEKSSASVA